ncbi:MAG: paraquat-inducible protein A [Gammaproteobacteria bacterium]
MNYLRATDFNLAECHLCHSIVKVDGSGELFCPTCDSRVSLRIRRSLSRTWAWLLTAVFFYIPANFLPVITTAQLGKSNPDTILSGVIYLLHEGMWPLALIVFIASIFVPLMKLIVLFWLLVSVHEKSDWRPEDRTFYYRITEFVGRWSMVDIFVIAILAALVQFGELAYIEVGAGSIAFAIVVIATMFAAHSFDPRLIWDACETKRE